jgi:hypothetical protein
MIHCLSCHRSWPDSALFCGHCKRSFGGRRCPHGHLSPRFATFCTTCGSKELSLATSSFSTQSVSRVVAWVIVLVLLKWILPYTPQILGSLLAAGDWLFGFIFGVRLGVLLVAVFHFCLQLAVLIGLFALFFPGFRKHLPALGRAFAKILRLVWKLCVVSARLAFRVLRYVAQGVNHESKNRKEGQGSRPHGT